MIGCNSTDDELEERHNEWVSELEETIKELRAENATLKEDVRLLEREKEDLEIRVDRLEDDLADERDSRYG